jgi:hypothetical protein
MCHFVGAKNCISCWKENDAKIKQIYDTKNITAETKGHKSVTI